MERSVAAAQATPTPSQCICLTMNDLMNFLLWWVLPIMLFAFLLAGAISKEMGLDKI